MKKKFPDLTKIVKQKNTVTHIKYSDAKKTWDKKILWDKRTIKRQKILWGKKIVKQKKIARPKKYILKGKNIRQKTVWEKKWDKQKYSETKNTVRLKIIRHEKSSVW